jgi:MFS family permease
MQKEMRLAKAEIANKIRGLRAGIWMSVAAALGIIAAPTVGAGLCLWPFGYHRPGPALVGLIVAAVLAAIAAAVIRKRKSRHSFARTRSRRHHVKRTSL